MSGASPTLSMIEEGCQVWAKDRRGTDSFPIGGVVVEVFDQADAETGEVQRAFRVVNVSRRRIVERVLLEREVDTETLQPFSGGIAVRTARALQAANSTETGTAMGPELARARWAARLYGIASGAAR